MNSNNKLLQDIFEAYHSARKNKRSKLSSLEFEIDYEKKIFELYNEIVSGAYEPLPSNCFVVKKPVKREVFAAQFRDRIIHHLIFNYINPVFEPTFIYDSYSCRLEKGTLFGIRRLEKFIRSCSQNYQKDCYVLKLDISGYFMSMNRSMIYEKIEKKISERNNLDFNKDLLLALVRKTIFNNPIKNCIIKGDRKDWTGLPKSKSLFFAKTNCGLPIGNLTSQLFANIYLNEFDHFVKKQLNIKYYGRYVDDMVFVHSDREYLKSVVSQVRQYLKGNLGLKLHEKKIYLQHQSKGVDFLGVIIKPYRLYIKNRSKANFYNKISFWNKFLLINKNKAGKTDIKSFTASLNSYIGMLKHYQTRKLRYKIINSLSVYFWNYVYIRKDFLKIRALL